MDWFCFCCFLRNSLVAGNCMCSWWNFFCSYFCVLFCVLCHSQMVTKSHAGGRQRYRGLLKFESLNRRVNKASSKITRSWNSRETIAKIEFLVKWPPWPSACATHRQTGWGLHQRGWSNDACETLQWRPCHELAWIWTYFFSKQLWVSVDLDVFLQQHELAWIWTYFFSNSFGRGDGFGPDSRKGGKSGWQLT